MMQQRKKTQVRQALLVGVLLQFLISGCASLRSNKGAESLSPEGVQISGVEDPSKQVMANISKPYVSPLGEIDLDVTPLTQQWIKYFQGRGRRYMEVYLQRSSRYLPMMKNTLRENGLPEDLVYIALIESGFSPLAHSHANAVGYWQFIRGTGKRYGLMLDPFIDERRDPVLSTRAAAEYFKTLYGLLGSWHLSMAAYNVGENRIVRAVAKHKTRDFWELTKKRKAFPKETKHYVPKFIAAALIAKDPAKYGFTDIAYEAPLAFDTVQLTNPISMTRLAQEMNIDLAELKLLNPKFRGDYVPQYRGPETVIRVPVGKMQVAAAAIPLAISAVPKVIASDYYFYRVRSGDSLSTIARKHRTSIANIRRMNNLGNRSFLRVGQKLKVQDRGGSFVSYEMPAPIEKKVSPQPVEGDKGAGGVTNIDVAVSETKVPDQNEVPQIKQIHVVRRGENLTIIARKYGLSVAQLRRLNKLNNRSILRAGQTLRLKTEDEENVSKSSAAQDSRRAKAVANSKLAMQKRKPARSLKTLTAKASKKHMVRKGETLAAIAERYRVTIGAIAKKNQIKNKSRLLAGSELLIPKN